MRKQIHMCFLFVLPQVLLHFSGPLPVFTCPPTLLPFPGQPENTLLSLTDVCHRCWPLYFPFRWLQMCPPQKIPEIALQQVRYQEGKGVKKKKSHAWKIRGMRVAWWRHVALMGPVTWHGCVVEMASKESFGRKVERSATVAALRSRLQTQKYVFLTNLLHQYSWETE